MDTAVKINFNVTPSEKETIDLRVLENGFDDISAYLKVVALKTEAFKPTTTLTSNEEADVELGFNVTESQKMKIEEKVQESGCDDLATYLRYVALHAVVSSVLEVRSTGSFEEMLKRIADSRNQ